MITRLFSKVHRLYRSFEKKANYGTVKTKTSNVAFPLGLSALGLLSLYGISSHFGKQKVSAEQTPSPFTDPNSWKKLELLGKKVISPDTSIYRFALENWDQTLGIPAVSSLIAKANIDGREVKRPYTPIGINDLGYFDIVVKLYPKGPMSKHIHSLKTGDTLSFSGPILKFLYRPNYYDQIAMLAGGTGITPMFQLIRTILENPNDNTKISLIFANKSEMDILFKEELDSLEAAFSNFKVFYTISKHTSEWEGGSGYITKEMIEERVPPPKEKPLILVCGPDAFINYMAGSKGLHGSQGSFGGLLQSLGYSKNQVFKF